MKMIYGTSNVHKLKDIKGENVGYFGNSTGAKDANKKLKEKVTYVKMDAKKALEVVEQHLIRGQVVTEYTIGNTLK